MFFTDYGSTPRVERCDMDGQNRTKLVDTKIVFPHGITLDLVNRLVYWADAYLDYIEVVDYEGKNRHTIIQGLLVRAGRCANLRQVIHGGARKNPNRKPFCTFNLSFAYTKTVFRTFNSIVLCL